jgi:Uma2 family endonuclease
MELMTLSPSHERAKHLLGLLLAVIVEELDIDVAGFGSMTFRREDLENGLEPDECYWIAHEAQVRAKETIDLTIDPPPDLFLEIEITRSFLNRLAICARLRVPEVWRWDGQRLRVCVLGSDGQYTESECSLAFPFLPINELERFLIMGGSMSETKLLRMFREWVRDQIARGWTG